MARAAEECGFDSIWIGDHLLYAPEDGRPERGPWEAWTLLAALAAATERVRLGPLVACAAFHPPALIAKMAATSRRSAAAASCWGSAPVERARVQRPRPALRPPGGRFEEAWTIIRGLLAGERVTLAGRFWQADDAVLLPRPAAPPPLMIGSNGPRMLSIALPHAAWWNTWFADFGNTAEGFAALNGRISEAARDGRPRPGGDRPQRLRVRPASTRARAASGATRATRPRSRARPAQIAERLRELGEAGADEVIVVASPITERSSARWATSSPD